MDPVDIIRQKRNGKELSKEDISSFVSGIADWSVTDSQIAAFSIAIYLNGLSSKETIYLTEEILSKGLQINWEGMSLSSSLSDVYTNEGIGDYLPILVPAVLASCGLYSPSVNGHYKEYICGILDKISSIEGYNPYPRITHLKNAVYDHGFAIIGTTGEFSPVYRRIRDVCASSGTITATDLIAISSIAQKKSVGLENLFLNIKFGTGCFIKDLSTAQKLSRTLKCLGEANKLNISGFISRHDQPTGKSVGASLEMLEAVTFLLSPSQTLYPRVYELLLSICSNILVLAGLFSHLSLAEEKVSKELHSGRVASRFSEMLTSLGSPPDFMKNPKNYLPQASIIKTFFAKESGYIKGIDCELLGRLWRDLSNDSYNLSIKPALGFSDIAQIGTHVTEDSLLALVHSDNSSKAEEVLKELPKVFLISSKRPVSETIIYETL